jgi:hypothetical protein
MIRSSPSEKPQAREARIDPNTATSRSLLGEPRDHVELVDGAFARLLAANEAA